MLSACSTTTHTPRQLLVQPSYKINHSSDETAEAYYQLARHHQGQGNLDVALSGYTYAIARSGAHGSAHRRSRHPCPAGPSGPGARHDAGRGGRASRRGAGA
ncbi:hypothetical protein LP420_30965 [Massilia sp. B-10]|nr:hypothetical protein LP420_30965 [Massilia sp. B-10]